MKSILVIGLGRFGAFMAMKFAELGNEVMVIDQSEDKVNEVLSKVTSAQIGDCTNEQVLRSLGIKNFDLCVVAIGNNFQSSLEITSLLKELGATYVLSKASRDTHAKFLLRNGADAITYPEKEMAERLAVRYSAKSLFEYVELTPEYSIFEIPPREDWIGKTIEQKAIRTKYHMSILAIKDGDQIYPIPKPDYMFTGKEHLIVIGKKSDILKRV